jgi:hypothetical protein
MNNLANEYTTANDAIHAKGPEEDAILLSGRFLVIPSIEADQLAEIGLTFAYLYRHEQKIVTIPVN